MSEKSNIFQGGIFVDAFWVLTFNIASQKWMGWAEREQVCSQVFSTIPARLVGFQEFGIDTWNILGPKRKDLKLIPGRVAGDINVNAIAYDHNRFVPIDIGTFWLSEDGTYKKAWDGSERGCSWALFRDTLKRREFLLVNVHLDNKGSTAKTKGMELVRDFILKYDSKLPVVITADSNVSVDSPDPKWKDPELRRPYQMMIDVGFVDSWKATHLGDPRRPFTYHAFQGQDYKGDPHGTGDTEWVLVRGFKPLNCVLIRDSVGGIYPSDHYPMMALINYPEDK